ncbi:MAG: D-aminoacyl-tRNA deacylase, partial [uncultured Chloroflexia bacterium]
MRALIQRVDEASVEVDGTITGQIARGLLVLLGVADGDTADVARKLAEKTANMRIFADADGKFNRSLLDTGGAVLLVSQFTLLADTRKGNRPSFIGAAPPDVARQLVDDFGNHLQTLGIQVEHGVFGAHMHVALLNDGPVTIMLDSDDWQR